jgi:hypothetical protein
MLLDANDMFYNEYFWWKDRYRVESGVEQMAKHGFCDLCKKLHQDEGVTKYYPELESEWHSKTQCRQMSSWERTTTSTVPPSSITSTSTTSTTLAPSTTATRQEKKMHEKIKNYFMNKLH